MKNKHVCFFISSLSGAGGTERVCVQIASKLGDFNYKITILTMYDDRSFFQIKKGIDIQTVYYKSPIPLFHIALKTFRLRKKLLQLKPDILINVDSALFMYSKLAGMGLSIKNVIWEHFNLNAASHSPARRLSRRFALKHSDAIITLSQADKKFWQDRIHTTIPVYAIPNPGPDVKPPSKNEQEKEQLVLAIGRLTHQKGFDRLLESWSILKMGGLHDWKLRIVGSGELKDQLEKRINDLRLRNSVQLIPATPAIERHYRQAAIFCLASRYEGFPMVLLEAQAYGLPIISFDCETGPSEIILDGEDGFLIKDGDCRAFANAIIALMNSMEKRAYMSNNALVKAENNGVDSVINKWIELISSL